MYRLRKYTIKILFFIIVLSTITDNLFVTNGFHVRENEPDRSSRRYSFQSSILQDSNETDQNGNKTDYDEKGYIEDLMDLSFNALKFIIVILILALSVSFVAWWVMYVFKIFPQMLADLTKRIDESYGLIGVFIFVVLFFPSLLVFIIVFLTRNVELLIMALEGLLNDLLNT
ncbi:MAG: hypothetical protein ACFFAJ_06790 [Candidatus Hodarchaeota archaeon]